MNDKEVGGNKLYLRPALKKAQREQEKKTEALRYKNSKKRCNLYVKNIPPTWTDLELRQVFGKYGEIEQIRVDKSSNGYCFAFVCYKVPDSAAQAKQSLNRSTFEGKTLLINHYEIKEVRQVIIEEAIDKADFEKYKAQENGGMRWTDLQSHPNLTAVIHQLLEFMHQEKQHRRRVPYQQRPQKLHQPQVQFSTPQDPT